MSRIIYYYQKFSTLKPILVPNTVVSHIHLSVFRFGNNSDGVPYIHFNDNDPNDPIFNTMWEEIRQAHMLGIKIILSLDLIETMFSNFFSDYNTYYPILVKTIKEHQEICGVELDIDEFTPIKNIEKLIKDLINDFGNEFIIAMTLKYFFLYNNIPGVNHSVYAKLMESDYEKYIQYFNVQFNSSHQFNDYDECIKNGYSPEKIVIETTSEDDIDFFINTLRQVKTKYPNMGGVSILAYFDAPHDWYIEINNILNQEQYKNYICKTLNYLFQKISNGCNSLVSYIFPIIKSIEQKQNHSISEQIINIS